MVLDATRPAMHKLILERELEGFGIRLNKIPPKIKVKPKEKGGISIIEIVKQTHMGEDTIKNIMREYKRTNCDITF